MSRSNDSSPLGSRLAARSSLASSPEPDARPDLASGSSSALNSGVAAALLGFVFWGVFPLYFRLVPSGAAIEILANRIVWALVLLLAVMLPRKRWAWLGAAVRSPRVLGAFALSAALLSANWLIYIWSATHGHVVDASLGYFMTPLINVLLGMAVLHERPRRVQRYALLLATTGVLWLTIEAGQLPWIGLALALSFGGYGLLRKVAPLGALEGLTLETLLLAPFALVAVAIWWGRSATSFPSADWHINLWLIGFGPLTAVPLLLFASGARKLTLTTLGILQYVSPTLQFVIGVWLFHEPLGAGRLAGFACIWGALVIYTAEGWYRSRHAAAITSR